MTRRTTNPHTRPGWAVRLGVEPLGPRCLPSAASLDPVGEAGPAANVQEVVLDQGFFAYVILGSVPSSVAAVRSPTVLWNDGIITQGETLPDGATTYVATQRHFRPYSTYDATVRLVAAPPASDTVGFYAVVTTGQATVTSIQSTGVAPVPVLDATDGSAASFLSVKPPPAVPLLVAPGLPNARDNLSSPPAVVPTTPAAAAPPPFAVPPIIPAPQERPPADPNGGAPTEIGSGITQVLPTSAPELEPQLEPIPQDPPTPERQPDRRTRIPGPPDSHPVLALLEVPDLPAHPEWRDDDPADDLDTVGPIPVPWAVRLPEPLPGAVAGTPIPQSQLECSPVRQRDRPPATGGKPRTAAPPPIESPESSASWGTQIEAAVLAVGRQSPAGAAPTQEASPVPAQEVHQPEGRVRSVLALMAAGVAPPALVGRADVTTSTEPRVDSGRGHAWRAAAAGFVIAGMCRVGWCARWGDRHGRTGVGAEPRSRHFRLST
jgi:hypothetical protein